MPDINWLRRNCLLKDALQGMVNGRRVRGRRRYQMIDDIKIYGSYAEIKRKAENGKDWRTLGLQIGPILPDSKAAILSIVSKHTPSSQTAEITKILSLDKRIVFQWIPSHCGILGNENADALAKKGSTATYIPVTKSTFRVGSTRSLDQWSSTRCPVTSSQAALKPAALVFRCRGHSGGLRWWLLFRDYYTPTTSYYF
ncbi:hypothetical protein ANN_07533 [Periplaneta americana]|uniref:RNase H type-1 domain-containing protein n=1 Tax=Periplaneta americana TaxID=6978 RepID=A0ABQ8SZ12_PERAM|nr:hypothetical protein ANN_07533 [Periplaneta americana]